MPGIRRASAAAAVAAHATAEGVAGDAPALYDVDNTSNHDLVKIVPIAIVAIALLLALVLRSLIAPLYLIFSVGLSYLAALGVAVLVFIDIGGDSGLTFVLPFLMFIFLLALGEDYNILVMTRIREEARHRDLPDAVAHAVGRTGPTITSAGLVLAGSFAVLAFVGHSGPGGGQIEAIGFGLAIGILMDTFLVRVVLVPATVVLLGRWNWWPTKLAMQPTDELAPTDSFDKEPVGSREGTVRPWSAELAGRIEKVEIASAALVDNPLGDASTRPLWVYLPPGYDESGDRYPAIYLLQGFGNFLNRWGDRSMFQRTAPELIDEAFANGAPPCLVVYVDAWTALGGSQFLDSPATGRYHTYLCEDVVSFVDTNYRTRPSSAHRAVAGHSSGGFGAIVSSLRRPDVFGAFAAHSPDCCFALTTRSDLALAHRALRDRYHSSYERFFADFSSRQPMSRPDDFVLVYIWALSACYSGELDGSVTLPFDPGSGLLRDDVWRRWLEVDPIEMVPRYEESVRACRGIWLDAGRGDEHLLDVATEQLAEALVRANANDLSLELYDGGHSDYRHRFPLSVAYLAERINQPD